LLSVLDEVLFDEEDFDLELEDYHWDYCVKYFAISCMLLPCYC
jgi:hypothetical protein